MSKDRVFLRVAERPGTTCPPGYIQAFLPQSKDDSITLFLHNPEIDKTYCSNSIYIPQSRLGGEMLIELSKYADIAAGWIEVNPKKATRHHKTFEYQMGVCLLSVEVSARKKDSIVLSVLTPEDGRYIQDLIFLKDKNNISFFKAFREILLELHAELEKKLTEQSAQKTRTARAKQSKTATKAVAKKAVAKKAVVKKAV